MARVMIVGFPKKAEKKFEKTFKTVGVTCDFTPAFEKAFENISSNPPTLVIAPYLDQPDDLKQLHHVLKNASPATPFLAVLSQHKANDALTALNAGAFDCLEPSWDSFRLLTAAKRATLANGRTLIGRKLVKKQVRWSAIVFLLFIALVAAKGAHMRWNGAPAQNLNLASATLSGIQWEGRSLWVGNWFDSTVTHYSLEKGVTAKSRALRSEEIFRMQDSQPILVCNTPESLVTIGFDLKLRTHQRSVGLPTLQTSAAPGNNPTGLTWDGQNLWSSDGQTGLLYKHGPDLRVIETIRSLIDRPVGLAWDGEALWVMGGVPLKLAKLERRGSAVVWNGPYRISNFMPADVSISGMAVGFNRLWAVSGGTPHMVSRPLTEIETQLAGWK